MMGQKATILIWTILLCQISKAADDDILKCEYTLSQSATHPGTGGPRTEWFSRFKLHREEGRLAPTFCDHIERSIVTPWVYYVDCYAEAESVRTDYDLLIERKTGKVTNIMDIQQYGETVVKMLHLGKCEQIEAGTIDDKAPLVFSPLTIDMAQFPEPPPAILEFQKEPDPEIDEALISKAGFKKKNHMVEALIRGPLLQCDDCNGETEEYCTATIKPITERYNIALNAMVEAFRLHADELITDGDMDLSYRSFGLIGEHTIHEHPSRSTVLTIVKDELVVSLENLPPTHPDRDPAKSPTPPWSDWHHVRTSDGTVGYVKAERAEVLLGGFETQACVAVKDGRVQVTRLREVP